MTHDELHRLAHDEFVNAALLVVDARRRLDDKAVVLDLAAGACIFYQPVNFPRRRLEDGTRPLSRIVQDGGPFPAEAHRVGPCRVGHGDAPAQYAGALVEHAAEGRNDEFRDQSEDDEEYRELDDEGGIWNEEAGTRSR